MVLEGSPELVLPNIVDRFSIDHVTTSYTPGWHETQAMRSSSKNCLRRSPFFAAAHRSMPSSSPSSWKICPIPSRHFGAR